jgi:hypothetical protein
VNRPLRLQAAGAKASPRDPFLRDAEKRAAAAAAPAIGGTPAGRDATREYLTWLLAVRKKLAEWEPGEGEPPITVAELQEAQREAVRRGGDARIISGLPLYEPKSLIELDAEQRLIRSVLGPDEGAATASR